MSLQLLKYNAGIVKDTTEYSAGKNGPFWVDSQLVRFVNGYPEKFGGWQKSAIYSIDPDGDPNSTETSISGICRQMSSWRGVTDGVDRIAVGTSNHLYIIENDALYDITPLRKTTSNLTNPITTANGSTEITVTDNGHGVQTGDFVVINSATATGGIPADTLNRMSGYEVELVSANTYKIQSPTAASSTATGGGTTIDIKYLIGEAENLGIQSSVAALGWGVGGWGGDGIGGKAGTTNNGEIIIGTEIIKYTGITSNTLTGCTRGFDNDPGPGGPATTHNNGATVTLRHFGLTTTLAEALDATEKEIDLTSASNFSGTNLSGFSSPATLADSTIHLENSSWSINIWDNDVIATLRNGKIYYWDTSAGVATRAVLVSSIANAASVPEVARISTVSFPDRHFIVAGASKYETNGSSGPFDPMLVRWSSQEEFAKFAPTTLNTAGDQRLEVGTKIVAMINSREETIISTDEAVYGMTFVGDPFIFSFRLLATGVGAVGINSMIAIDGNAFWMGPKSFYVYDGVVKEIPCPLKHFVFDRMQTAFIGKTVVGHNVEFSEIIWFYVSDQSTATDTDNPEPDAYVTYNYNEQAWAVGEMDRTVWNDAFGAREKPFAFSSEGFLYNQETGTSDDGAAMNCFIEASPREITAEGENLYMVDRVIPDATMGANSNLSLFMNTRKYPNGAETVKGPFNITSTTEKISTRVKGRQIALKFQSTGTQDEWQLGDLRIDTKMAGLR